MKKAPRTCVTSGHAGRSSGVVGVAAFLLVAALAGSVRAGDEMRLAADAGPVDPQPGEAPGVGPAQASPLRFEWRRSIGISLAGVATDDSGFTVVTGERQVDEYGGFLVAAFDRNGTKLW